MGNPQIFTTYVHFTTMWYWSINANLFVHGKSTDLETLGMLDDESERATKLLRVMESFFVDWHRAVGDDSSKTDYYVPFCGHDFMQRTHAYLNERPADEEFIRDFRAKLASLEQLATEIFWMAVQDLPDPPQRRPIDPYAISFDPARWEADGLFDVSQTATAEPVDWNGDPIDWNGELVDLHGFDRRPARASADRAPLDAVSR
jgi:hypothetical protein